MNLNPRIGIQAPFASRKSEAECRNDKARCKSCHEWGLVIHDGPLHLMLKPRLPKTRPSLRHRPRYQLPSIPPDRSNH